MPALQAHAAGYGTALASASVRGLGPGWGAVSSGCPDPATGPVEASALAPPRGTSALVLRFGPIQLSPLQLVALLAVLGAAFWFVRALFLPLGGSWERVDDAGASEQIHLVQFGPFVRGRRVVSGGFQEFAGILRGRTVFLTRRDYGAAMITAQGFPPAIATKIDGTITARLRLTLSAEGDALFGTFSPQKIEFTHEPPAISARTYQAPTHRRYRRSNAPAAPRSA